MIKSCLACGEPEDQCWCRCQYQRPINWQALTAGILNQEIFAAEASQAGAISKGSYYHLTVGWQDELEVLGIIALNKLTYAKYDWPKDTGLRKYC